MNAPSFATYRVAFDNRLIKLVFCSQGLLWATILSPPPPRTSVLDWLHGTRQHFSILCEFGFEFMFSKLRIIWQMSDVDFDKLVLEEHILNLCTGTKDGED